ncbi:MAG: exosortase/archaeosortase family protein [Methanobacteriota archaeon]
MGGLSFLARLGERHRRTLVLVALLTTFAGADLALNRPKGSDAQWFAIPFLAAGAALFAWAVWPRGVAPAKTRSSLASRVLGAITWRGRLIPYFPVFGVALIAADLAYNATVSATPAILTEDTIVLLAAGSLVAYGFVPPRFARERDFVLVFFLALNAILVVPLLAARAFYQDFERSVDLYSWTALAPPVSGVLSAIGVDNTVHAVAGSTAPGLTFVPVNLGFQVTVVITTACSGIYSFGIFASAFVAFVLTEFERPTRRMWVLLGLGFLAAYAANVLRMVAIVLVGYYTDTAETDLQNMLVAHSYAGWLIFLAWIALFWGVLLKALPVARSSEPAAAPPAPRVTARCRICGDALSPAIPATRCACGAIHHEACRGTSAGCPACGRTFRIDPGIPSRGA